MYSENGEMKDLGRKSGDGFFDCWDRQGHGE